ncbi:MAG: hypothetical protein WC860_05290 [Candidatus Margulisiibacteriota bacterium]|jgi:F0F1-type ATP synthase epsilon subunit
MNKQIKYRIILPESPTVEGESEKLVFNSRGNPFTVLADHAPMLGVINRGSLLVYEKSSDAKEYGFQEGYFNIKDNEVTVNILR